LDAVAGGLDFGEGEVCNEVGLGPMEKERGRGTEKHTDFRNDAGHVEALSIADAAVVLGIEARADRFEAVTGCGGVSQCAGYQGENEESCWVLHGDGDTDADE
jgi:hypothetical protein